MELLQLGLTCGGLFKLALRCKLLFLSFYLQLSLFNLLKLVVCVFDLSVNHSNSLIAVVHCILLVLKFDAEAILFLLEGELGLHARFFLVQRD